ncbi:prion-inhibition and propagation-domain-containing protein [Triangularia verruculosa]|uniref:Prion-inhibition and propagation-domain-containing protein n=1 Tax=Triangularia verruculosa TaxID=2587418 RepID=A0AAN6XCL0_9PEZI|nr:prion-inhibition and propagation-domain-containing protein [Triangularia verruculosa]
MAETAGLAIGALGLASLFSTCAGCYQLVRLGTELDKDYRILETKFSNQELRLLSWGRACGLSGADADLSHNTQLSDPILRSRIVATLECIKQLFQDETELRDRFGLKPPQQRGSNRNSALQLLGSKSLGAKRPYFFWKKEQQRVARLWDAASWAISDRDRFAQLVQHLKDFNDDLEAMTRSFGDISRKQRYIVEAELSEVFDLETLEEIADASRDNDGLISDAVSLRLSSLRSGSIRETHDDQDSPSFDARLKTIPATTDEILIFSQSQAFGSTSPLLEPPSRTKFQCVVVGDRNAGKTRLLSAFAYDRLPGPYSPMIFDSCVVGCRVDEVDLQLELKDTSGQEEYDQLRAFSYKGADVVLLCFRAENPTAETRKAILGKWSWEIRSHCPQTPIILVGLKNPGQDVGVDLVPRTESSDQFIPLHIMKDIGATRYFFCDPETGFGVRDLLEYTLRIAVQCTQPTLPTPTRVKRGSRVTEIMKDLVAQFSDD